MPLPPRSTPNSDQGEAPRVVSGLLSRYRLYEVIGTGGMGTVYEAEDENLGRRVALKLQREEVPGSPTQPKVSKSGVERFLREARITAMLEHPNIVPVLEVGELEDGVPYYTQRLVPGRTLSKALAAARRWRAGPARWRSGPPARCAAARRASGSTSTSSWRRWPQANRRRAI